MIFLLSLFFVLAQSRYVNTCSPVKRFSSRLKGGCFYLYTLWKVRDVCVNIIFAFWRFSSLGTPFCLDFVMLGLIGIGLNFNDLKQMLIFKSMSHFTHDTCSCSKLVDTNYLNVKLSKSKMGPNAWAGLSTYILGFHMISYLRVANTLEFLLG